LSSQTDFSKNGNESIMVTITFLHFFCHFIFGFAKMDKNKCPKSKNQKTFAEKKTLFYIYYNLSIKNTFASFRIILFSFSIISPLPPIACCIITIYLSFSDVWMLFEEGLLSLHEVNKSLFFLKCI